MAVGGNRGLFAATKLSRYCSVGFDYPVSTDDPDALVDAIVEFVRARSLDLIVPITDWTLRPIPCGESVSRAYAVLPCPLNEPLIRFRINIAR